MGRVCVICSHPRRLEIDREVLRQGNLSKIAKEYNLPYNSLYAHSKDHISHQLATAMQKQQTMESMNIIGDVEELITRTKRILTEVENKKRHGIALAAIRELRGHYELLSKIAFALHQARLAELEHERMNSQCEDEAENEEIRKRLERLTDEELRQLQHISWKAFRESWDDYGLPAPRQHQKEEPPKMRRTKPPKNEEPEPEPEMEPPIEPYIPPRKSARAL